MESTIFTKTEYEEVEKRLQGKKENYKIWFRAKPKIIEMLDKWFSKKKQLQNLIKNIRKNN